MVTSRLMSGRWQCEPLEFFPPPPPPSKSCPPPCLVLSAVLLRDVVGQVWAGHWSVVCTCHHIYFPLLNHTHSNAFPKQFKQLSQGGCRSQKLSFIQIIQLLVMQVVTKNKLQISTIRKWRCRLLNNFYLKLCWGDYLTLMIPFQSINTNYC